MDEIKKKWNTIYQESYPGKDHASRVLIENSHLLPASGTALDIACGLGNNAVFLARNGLNTCAWDISSVAVEKINQLAKDEKLSLTAEVQDLSEVPTNGKRYDVIVVSHFLERALVPFIKDALAPGGLVFYQTFTQACVGDVGPKNQEFRLAENELLKMFAEMQILVYREEDKVGDINQGFRNEALLVARKKPELDQKHQN